MAPHLYRENSPIEVVLYHRTEDFKEKIHEQKKIVPKWNDFRGRRLLLAFVFIQLYGVQRLSDLSDHSTALMTSCQFFSPLVSPADTSLSCYNIKKPGSGMHGHKSIWHPLPANGYTHEMHFSPAFCTLLYEENTCLYTGCKPQNETDMVQKSGYNTALHCYNAVFAIVRHDADADNYQ